MLLFSATSTLRGFRRHHWSFPTSLSAFCRIESPGEEEETGFGEMPLCLASLNSLALHNSARDPDILRLLTLPRLQDLELGGRYAIWNSDLDADLIPFLARVGPTLRSFTVGMSPTLPIQWLEPLMHLTTLELIHPANPPITTDVIRALDRRSAPDFLPKLQHFTYSSCGTDQPGTELLDALGSRCDVGDAARAPLESCNLHWYEYGLRTDTPTRSLSPLVNSHRLRALADRGLRIHVGTREQNYFH
ncbi:hypothetical protein C8J57DRAFT_1244977 [Mycena rebaudengoi]|nr:hypothetical protein C8J57DRAFT_1244977 [Mycena rebaudengoi]